jgi:hypothetical protein
MDQLRASVNTLAAEKGVSALAIITELQAAAALTNNDDLLDMLSDLKWEFIG